LSGLSSTCSTGPNKSMYNGCTGGNFGFQWTDTAGTIPVSIVVELNRGISCTSYTASTTLNGQSSGSFKWATDSKGCYCDPSTNALTWTLTNVSGFVPGGANRFLISGSSCEGLTENSSWSGAYAMVTVTY
jgi:hypothetical protein